MKYPEKSGTQLRFEQMQDLLITSQTLIPPNHQIEDLLWHNLEGYILWHNYPVLAMDAHGTLYNNDPYSWL